MLRFAIRNAFRRKWIAAIAIAGTALGCSLMAVLLSISDGMDRMLNQTMDTVAGHVVIYPRDAPMAIFFGGGTPLPSSYIEDIEGIEHVEVVSPSVTAFIPSNVLYVGDPMGFTLIGIDLGKDALMDGATVHIVEGRSIESPNEVIVGRRIRDYAQRNVSPDALKIGYTFTMTKIGTVPPQTIELRIVGVFETGNLLTDSSMYGEIDTVREISGLKSNEVSSIRVRAEGTEWVERVAANIEEIFQDAPVPISVMISSDILGDINETMDTFRGFIWVIGLVAAVAGGISVFIVMFMSVVERRQEFGILKASGWSNMNIISSVVVQSITLAIIGAMVGLAIGYGAARGIDYYLAGDIAIVTAKLFLEIVAFGIIIGVLGGLYPALRASQISPIETLRTT